MENNPNIQLLENTSTLQLVYSDSSNTQRLIIQDNSQNSGDYGPSRISPEAYQRVFVKSILGNNSVDACNQSTQASQQLAETSPSPRLAIQVDENKGLVMTLADGSQQIFPVVSPSEQLTQQFFASLNNHAMVPVAPDTSQVFYINSPPLWPELSAVAQTSELPVNIQQTGHLTSSTTSSHTIVTSVANNNPPPLVRTSSKEQGIQFSSSRMSVEQLQIQQHQMIHRQVRPQFTTRQPSPRIQRAPQPVLRTPTRGANPRAINQQRCQNTILQNTVHSLGQRIQEDGVINARNSGESRETPPPQRLHLGDPLIRMQTSPQPLSIQSPVTSNIRQNRPLNPNPVVQRRLVQNQPLFRPLVKSTTSQGTGTDDDLKAPMQKATETQTQTQTNFHKLSGLVAVPQKGKIRPTYLKPGQKMSGGEHVMNLPEFCKLVGVEPSEGAIEVDPNELLQQPDQSIRKPNMCSTVPRPSSSPRPMNCPRVITAGGHIKTQILRQPPIRNVTPSARLPSALVATTQTRFSTTTQETVTNSSSLTIQQKHSIRPQFVSQISAHYAGQEMVPLTREHIERVQMEVMNKQSKMNQARMDSTSVQTEPPNKTTDDAQPMLVQDTKKLKAEDNLAEGNRFAQQQPLKLQNLRLVRPLFKHQVAKALLHVTSKTVITSQSTSTSTSTSTTQTPLKEDMPKLIPGFLAICPYCGIFSQDFNKCARCRRKLPETVKQCPEQPKVNEAGVNFQKKENQTPVVTEKAVMTNNDKKDNGKNVEKTTPKTAAGKKKKVEEPEILVLSSDDEDDGKISSQSDTNQPTMTNDSLPVIEKEPTYSYSEYLSRGGANSFSPEEIQTFDDRLILSNPDESFVALIVKSIRVGNYKTEVNDRMLVSKNGLLFNSGKPSDGSIVKIGLKMEEIKNILIYYERNAIGPVIFIYPTISAVKRIKFLLELNDPSFFMYCPVSGQESQKRIVIYLEKISEDNRVALENIVPSKILEELTEIEALNVLKLVDTKLVKPPPNELTPSKRILTYEGEQIDTWDYQTLEEEAYLNDAIINFYFKYIYKEILSDYDRERTFMFSTFFYTRLTQKISAKDSKEFGKETLAEKRHRQICKWTKKINIFEKDFIIVPINESQHWYLAIICFPYLTGPVRFSDNSPIHVEPTPKKSKVLSVRIGDTTITHKPASASVNQSDGVTDTEDANVKDTKKQQSTPSRTSSSRQTCDEPIKQPCILIFDSLRANATSNRSRVVNNLREFLRVEYRCKTGVTRDFSRDLVKGCVLRVPQQTNYSDCGIFMLQYAESFFDNPIKDYRLPIRGLQDWFSDEVTRNKREDISNLIIRLMEESGVSPQSVNLPFLHFKHMDDNMNQAHGVDEEEFGDDSVDDDYVDDEEEDVEEDGEMDDDQYDPGEFEEMAEYQYEEEEETYQREDGEITPTRELVKTKPKDIDENVDERQDRIVSVVNVQKRGNELFVSEQKPNTMGANPLKAVRIIRPERQTLVGSPLPKRIKSTLDIT